MPRVFLVFANSGALPAEAEVRSGRTCLSIVAGASSPRNRRPERADGMRDLQYAKTQGVDP